MIPHDQEDPEYYQCIQEDPEYYQCIGNRISGTVVDKGLVSVSVYEEESVQPEEFNPLMD